MKALRNRRILVIDDQETIHEDYRKVIGAHRPASASLNDAAVSLFGAEVNGAEAPEVFEIDSAYQGDEGLRLVLKSLEEGRPYALAFVDMRMPPGWDGIETVKKIWEVDPEILVVICSAYSDYSWEEMIEHLGQSDRFLILKKPFERIEVRQFAMALTERWNLARTDVLTGLLNRRAFAEHLQLEWRRALRHGTPLSCAMVDLDFFKRINDEIGHAAGDAVLRAVADTLRRRSRPNDSLCRFGGEELCALLPNTDEAGARVWGEKMRLAIAALHVPALSRLIQLTASVGVATLRREGQEADALVEQADAALRSAKQRGRNRTVVSSEVATSGDQHGYFSLLASPLNSVRAAEVMNSPIPCLLERASIEEAAELLLQSRASSLPVIDDQGTLVGVISERDIMQQMMRPAGPSQRVGSLMNTNVVAYSEDTPVSQIFEFLSRVTVGQVFIVCGQRPLGAINRSSLLRWLSAWLHADRSPADVMASAAFMDHARDRLVQVAQELASEAGGIKENSADSAGCAVPPLLEVMFKMQELMNDLLASTQRAGSPAVQPSLVLPCATSPAETCATVHMPVKTEEPSNV